MRYIKTFENSNKKEDLFFKLDAKKYNL